jgi:dTDP-4-dehydrorhamnose 3,5-epimerase
MKFIPQSIPDVILIQTDPFQDSRGFFWESYNEEEFARHGIPVKFIQDNHSISKAGVIRGLHYQIEPHAQAKLIRVIKGAIYDVAVDIRPGSPTLGKYAGHELSAANRHLLYVPAGFAHGFCALEDTEVLYKVSRLYAPEFQRGIRYDDPAIAIAWPKMNYLLSDKDKNFPFFEKNAMKRHA